MPDPGSRRWTAHEISNLKKLAQKQPAAQVAAKLGRSQSATVIKGMN